MAVNEYEIKKQICDIGKRIYNSEHGCCQRWQHFSKTER